MPGEPLPNPDIVVRERGLTYFVPETPIAEEWLLTRRDARRPEAKEYRKGKDIYLYGEVGKSEAQRGPIRGFVVLRSDLDRVWRDAAKAGLVIRRVG